MLTLAVYETREIGATPGLLRAFARDFIAERLAGEIERTVDYEIDRQVKNGVLVKNGLIVRLAQPLRGT